VLFEFIKGYYLGYNNKIMLTFHIITIFPHLFDSYFSESILRRAQKKNLIKIKIYNLRDFSRDRRKTVDDKPYGGGPGMVLKIEPIYRAVSSIKRRILIKNKRSKIKTILFSIRGKKFDQKTSQRLSRYEHLILICGRYEGVDERVAKYIADEEISIGDYILSGGELPALVLIEAVSRYLPGVLGKRESLEEIKGSYPVYTRPPIFCVQYKRPDSGVFLPTKGKKLTVKKQSVLYWKVPEVLLSGNHKAIKTWREKWGRSLL